MEKDKGQVKGPAGPPQDTAETLPFSPAPPDSQVPCESPHPNTKVQPEKPNHDDVNDLKIRDPFVAELVCQQRRKLGEEEPEEEGNTDDEMVEPVLTHEQHVYEEKDEKQTELSSASSMNKPALDAASSSKQLEQNKHATTADAAADTQPQMEPEETQPGSPEVNCVVDSDEEKEMKDKKGGKKTVDRGTFRDTQLHYRLMIVTLLLIVSSYLLHNVHAYIPYMQLHPMNGVSPKL